MRGVAITRGSGTVLAALRGRLSYGAVAVALIATGAVARLIALVVNWSAPLGADSSEYLLLARRYSFSDPFSASYREPLWRALVKLATGPFGYSPQALRVFTTVISIATLPLAWLVFRRLASRWRLQPRVALIALAVFALSQQLVREAPRGLREGLCLLIVLVVVAPLLNADRSRRAALALAAAIGLLSSIRWELATLLLAITALFAVARRVSPLAPLLALLCLIALSGPWLLAHKERHGDISYPSKVHSTFYWKLEQPPEVVRRYLTPPGAEPKVQLSWHEYYLDYLGPTEAAKRVATGYPHVLAKLAASQVAPRAAAVSLLGKDQGGLGWLVSLVLVGAALTIVSVLVAVRLWRHKRAEPLTLSALVFLLVSIAPYAALAAHVEMRVLMFTAPAIALLVATAVDACLPQSVPLSRRSRRPAAVQIAGDVA
jgi:hypothetical protein